MPAEADNTPSDVGTGGDGAPAENGRKKKPLLLVAGLGLALLLGGGAGAATFLGLVDLPFLGGGKTETHAASGMPQAVETRFLPLPQMVVPVGTGAARQRHLLATLTIETTADAEPRVKHLEPRVIDVLNTYLRAVDPSEIEDPAAMLRLRAQMLRRVHLVAGAEGVQDLLISEFIVN
ncbi:flagellar basal body-associated FliL family protein [Futiania mangrovi]|uniref:Flagellar protein FliL n=1 Tax=Futiania mangrovi TaxID=2959716 RepID=A0A9J6P9Z2_9PROT|nr:flagellar basal body-associated FliL family protein [Futiania mangrovii]MCP1336836.1 flagellar basal body-associated FliL family protein [Futiania mangrovii]